MKKITILLLICATILAATSAFADDDDTKVTLGIKGWYNWWSHTVDYADGTSHTWSNGSAFMLGPSLNIKAGGLFFGGSYLQALSNYKAPNWFDNGGDVDTMEFKRSDIDVNLGYMFSRYFGIYVGYKSINAPMEYTNPKSTPKFSSMDFGTWTLKGPGAGIVANAPLGSAAALYGNLAVLSVKQKYDYKTETFTDSTGYNWKIGPEDERSMTGASFELGAAFALSDAVSTNVGFKYQTFWGDDGFGDTDYQNFYGLTLGLNYSF